MNTNVCLYEAPLSLQMCSRTSQTPCNRGREASGDNEGRPFIKNPITIIWVATETLWTRSLLARAQDDAPWLWSFIPSLLQWLNLGWIYPQTPNPSWALPFVMDPPSEAREEEKCPVPQAQQPLPCCSIGSPKEAHQWPELSRICWRCQALLPGRQPRFCLLLSKQTRTPSFHPVHFLKTLSSWLKVTTSCFHLLGLNQWCLASGQGQPSKGSTTAPANA